MRTNKTKAFTNWEELAAVASRDRRREVRVPLAFLIEVSGCDRKGTFFLERTETADVSENGCRFHSNAELERGLVIAVKLVNRAQDHGHNGNTENKACDARPRLFRVVRVKKEAQGWTVGAEKLHPENIWCVDFPASQRGSPD